jgi:hypothetical protein
VSGRESIAQTIETIKNSPSSTSSGSTSATTTSDSEYQTILAKANSGQQLTNAELVVLQEKNPAAYARAIRAKTASQESASPVKYDQVVISYRE